MYFRLLLILLYGSVYCYASKILVLCPYRGHSHTVGPLRIADELAKRGHQVTVASFFPKTEITPNYTSISLKMNDMELKGFYGIPDETLDTLTILKDIYAERAVYFPVMGSKIYQDLQNQKFDLILLEYFCSDMIFALVHKIGAPFIVLQTTRPYPWQNDLFGEPQTESYLPHGLNGDSSTKMTYFQRLRNFIEVNGIVAAYMNIFVPEDQKVAEKYFGPLPKLRTIAREASMFFVNTHYSITIPTPRSPATVEIGGIHISPPKPLSEDLKTLLDNSKEGAIFFSMGSVMKGSSLVPEKKAIFLNVFKELKQTVLWKWEEDLTEKSANVHTSPWYAQRDIFAHPNVVLYIGHCGALGLQEAVTEAIPTICMPLFADQHSNAWFLNDTGMGWYLDYRTLSEKTLHTAISKVLQEKTYKENAVRTSKAFLDRPMSAVDTVIYWSEYVIRHNGAPHMKSPARYMTWIEFHNVDVICTLIFMICFVIYIPFTVINYILLKSKRKVKTS